MQSGSEKKQKWLEELDSYREFHQTKANRYSHYFGIPLIVFSLFCCLSWVHVPISRLSVSGAELLLFLMVVFYLRISKFLALGFLVWCFPLWWLAEKNATMPFALSASIALGAFVIGWVFQFLGHSLEKNKPAFFKGVSHLWRGPLFITYEWVTSIGIKF